MSDAYRTAQSFLRVYQKSASEFWAHLTPQQYAMILIGVAFCGWLMMRTNWK